ncbi:MAG: hypothetical protein JRI44_13265 [Deltaproteobacteria bacterium]|nr:hypothetical protein [Deltaproteobacteria bacterium]
MRCLNCNKLFSSKRKDAKFCSPKCRKEYWIENRTDNQGTDNGTDKSTTGTDNQRTDILDTSEIDIEQVKKEVKADGEITFENSGSFLLVKTGDKYAKVYGRRAVIYPDERKSVTNSFGANWITRPEPEIKRDKPDPTSRCYYKRADKTSYWISATGEI